MRGSYTVALVGFSQQEAATLESFLRLAARRPPGYRVQDEVMDAQILIVNADNPQALHLVRHAELPGRVMLIGNTDAGTGWPLQRKPVKLVAVLAELDRIVGLQPAALVPVADRARATTDVPRPPPPTPPRPGAQARFQSTEICAGATVPPMAPAVSQRRRSRDSEFQPTRPMHRTDPTPPTPAAVARSPAKSAPVAPLPVRRAAPASTSVQRPGVMRMTDFGGLDELPMPSVRAAPSRRSGESRPASAQRPAPEAPEASEAPELPRGDVLLVAESLVEGRNLLKRFRKYSLAVDWSREPAQALVMLKAHPYRMVVIDRLSGQPDAFQVCRSAKQHKHGGRAPVVVMFAAIAGSMDRMKAGLAGCDAYLSRAVGEADLYKVLAQHRLVNLDAFAKTNIGM
jgi:CheY-like chemotaxis protein